MAKTHVEDVIHSKKGDKDSVIDMVPIAHGFRREGYGPTHDGIRRKQVEDALDLSLTYDVKTSLSHLVDIEILKTDPENADDLRTFAVAEWQGPDGEIINGQTEEIAEEAIEELIAHMQATESGGTPAIADGGVTIRTVLAENFGVVPDAVENRLRSGDPVNTLRSAVFSIQERPEVETGDDYGFVTFRNEAYRYTLTRWAVDLYEK